MFDDLLDACRRNDLERVRSLVAADPTMLMHQTPSGETPLLAALYAGSGETTGWLRDQHWPRNAFEAAAVDDVARLQELLDSDPQVADTFSADGWSPLHLAAFFGARPAAELLLARGADHRLLSRNHMANTPLHAALAAKRLSVAELLLEAGADPTISAAGWTPLAIAEGGQFDAGAALIRTALRARGAM
ncbi:MAG: ankyrin repeat domain-containing protein [Gemmatimonadales bacterium]